MTDAHPTQTSQAPEGERYRPAKRRHEQRLPLPSKPPPMPRFGGDADRHPQARGDFTFRPSGEAPRYPERPRSPPERRRGRLDRRGGPNRRGRGDFNGRNRPYGGRRFERVATSARPLLKFERGTTPEQLAGMNGGDEQTESKFVDMDDVSDSEELSMVESESDAGSAVETKRRKVAERKEPDDDFPKWSNPELYTSLPPLDDATERKRRDVVKLIRKARVSAAKENTQPAAVDDFIGFDFGSADEEEAEALIPGAPTGPRALEKSRHVTARSDGADDETTSRALHTPAAIAFEASVAARFVEQNRKRKRSVEEMGNLRAPEVKRGRGKFSGGIVVPQWKATGDINPTPWLSLEASQPTAHGGLRLHKEICDFYAFVRPHQFEQQMRADLLKRIQAFIAENFGPSCFVHAFGSFAAGLYLPNADMDLVVISERFRLGRDAAFGQSKKSMYQLSGLLERAGIARKGSCEVVPSAKVPIIKFVDAATHLHVDLSFENDSGIIANDTFLAWKAQFPAMPILVTVIKQFLMMRGLNNNATGGLGGFSVTCLVVSMLQLLPQVQLGEVEPERHLGEMLLEFLDYYGNQFDLSRTAISMEPPGLVSKEKIPIGGVNGPNKATRLCIVDPNRPDNDISGGTKEIVLIFSRFAEARQDIFNAMSNPSSPSLLPLQGNYNDFLWHRYQLRQLYEQTYGQIEEDDE